ncbi:MAG: hypothetical protein R2716_03300 [Microthrixaceae bacterium]
MKGIEDECFDAISAYAAHSATGPRPPTPTLALVVRALAVRALGDEGSGGEDPR